MSKERGWVASLAALLPGLFPRIPLAEVIWQKNLSPLILGKRKGSFWELWRRREGYNLTYAWKDPHKSRATLVSLLLAFIDVMFPHFWRREVFPYLYQDSWLVKWIPVDLFGLWLELNHWKPNLQLLQALELIRTDFNSGSVRAFLCQEWFLAIKSLDRIYAQCSGDFVTGKSRSR